MFEQPAEEVSAVSMSTSSEAASFAELTAERDGVSAGEVPSPRMPSAAVAALVEAVDAVLALVPADLPGPQSLADTAVLLEQVERLRGGLLGHIADVECRKLYLLDGAGSVSSWVDAQQTSLTRGEVALARRMSALPTLEAAVRDGELAVAGAEQIGKALAKLRRHVDRPDGRIDGQDGEQALVGVIGHGVPSLVLQSLGGLPDDDPRVQRLLDDCAAIVESRGSQYARLEAAFVLLGRWVEPAVLGGALGQLVDALLPNELEQKAADAYANRGFGIRLNSDGSGYRVTDGDLDLETGELLLAFLESEKAVDPDNPRDTEGYQQLRNDGWQSGDPVPDAGGPAHAGGCSGPRSRRQRDHDALRNGLRRYLDAGIAGLRDKVAPHLCAIAGVDLLDGVPGALPAVSARTGASLPASLIRSWLGDSAVSRFVLSLGRKVIETSHTERTLKPHERRAKRIETGGRCQGLGCRRFGRIPHHPQLFSTCGTTSLGDTVWLCDATHRDVHVGKKTIRLKDGRWLNESGWTDGLAAG